MGTTLLDGPPLSRCLTPFSSSLPFLPHHRPLLLFLTGLCFWCADPRWGGMSASPTSVLGEPRARIHGQMGQLHRGPYLGLSSSSCGLRCTAPRQGGMPPSPHGFRVLVPRSMADGSSNHEGVVTTQLPPVVGPSPEHVVGP